jgi:hypothetical protein
VCERSVLLGLTPDAGSDTWHWNYWRGRPSKAGARSANEMIEKRPAPTSTVKSSAGVTWSTKIRSYPAIQFGNAEQMAGTVLAVGD